MPLLLHQWVMLTTAVKGKRIGGSKDGAYMAGAALPEAWTAWLLF
jgi:hypothetical protein